MIKINRGECPAVLLDVEGGAERYKDPDVLTKLAEMQHYKCCYCEKRIGEAGHDRAVEHFRPKAAGLFPELANEWSNLLHACVACNGKKWKAFPTDADGNPLIIDPSNPALDPEEHLDFGVDDEDTTTFGSIRERGDFPERGRQTIKCIGLDLIARRRERVSIFTKLFVSYMAIVEAGDDPESQRQTREAFRNLLTANNAYAGFARAFARKKKVTERFGIPIPVGHE